MPRATLLLRELLANHSLTSIVERSQTRRPPLPEYELRLTATHLEISSTTAKPNQFIKPIQTDEGFESDIDTLSLISSDDSFTSSTCLVEDHVLKHRENDSANGSASSDSDTETVVPSRRPGETFFLADVLCYTDVKCPKVLLFVIKDEVLVFSIEVVEHLHQFYTSFNTFKAVTNQRTYGKNPSARFNLLHRTDNNGVTHIEISREPQTELVVSEGPEPTNIISINTPDVIKHVSVKSKTAFFESKSESIDDSRVRLQSELRTSRSEFYPNKNPTINSFTLKPKVNSASKEAPPQDLLLKVWKSAEDLLDAPKRPERRRKPKGRAPPPPIDVSAKQNIMKGQFVRVSVDPKNQIRPEEPVKNFKTFSSNVQTFTPNWNNIRQQPPLVLTTVKFQPQSQPQPSKIYSNFKIPEFKPSGNQTSWTNSVPRLLKPRSRSETRHVTPMAYRYIDTTSKPQPTSYPTTHTISNRLFGLSQKLKEFGTNVVSNSSKGFNYYDSGSESRRNSTGEMSYKSGGIESNLKSVIKKQDDRKTKTGSEHKKVTFSAYTTVQVV